jgi:hypothetical protein
LIERLLLDNVWFAIALSAIFYIATYLLGLRELYLYHTSAKDYLIIPLRYNLRPETQAFVPQRKWFNWKFAAVLIIQSIGLWAAWQIAIGQYQRSDVFAMILGGTLLLELADIALHIRNIAFFIDVSNGHVKGKLEYSARTIAAQLVYDLYIFTALYAFAFLVTSSWLFLGGAVTCFVSSRRQKDWTVVKT